MEGVAIAFDTSQGRSVSSGKQVRIFEREGGTLALKNPDTWKTNANCTGGSGQDAVGLFGWEGSGRWVASIAKLSVERK